MISLLLFQDADENVFLLSVVDVLCKLREKCASFVLSGKYADRVMLTFFYLIYIDV